MMDRVKHYADLVATFAVIALAAVLIWAVLGKGGGLSLRATAKSPTPTAKTKRVEPALPIQPIPIDKSKSVGSPDARVALVIFSDFECPFCAVFSRDTLPGLVSEYVKTGRLRLFFENYPLTSIHKFAAKAALAGECAAQDGRFWPMHDQLFAAPRGRLSDEDLVGYAAAAGLDRVGFKRCLDSLSPAILEPETELGQKLGVSGTPTFFVGTITPTGVKATKLLTGVRPPEDFRAAIASALSGGQP